MVFSPDSFAPPHLNLWNPNLPAVFYETVLKLNYEQSIHPQFGDLRSPLLLLLRRMVLIFQVRVFPRMFNPFGRRTWWEIFIFSPCFHNFLMFSHVFHGPRQRNGETVPGLAFGWESDGDWFQGASGAMKRWELKIWGFPEIGVPLVIIQFLLGFSWMFHEIHYPAIGVPQCWETSIWWFVIDGYSHDCWYLLV